MERRRKEKQQHGGGGRRQGKQRRREWRSGGSDCSWSSPSSIFKNSGLDHFLSKRVKQGRSASLGEPVRVSAANNSSLSVDAAMKDNICSLTGEQQPRLLSTLTDTEVNTPAASLSKRSAALDRYQVDEAAEMKSDFLWPLCQSDV